MKKLLGSLLLLLSIGCLSSCRNDLDSLETGNYRGHNTKEESVLKTIRMNFGGDLITETEEPLLRAEDGDTYTAINVFRTEKGVENATEEKYAYGLFKKKEGIDIKLWTGYTYRFEATILIEREDKVFLVNNSYAEPFEYSTDRGGLTGLCGYNLKDLNSFKYTTVNSLTNESIEDRNREYFQQLSCGTANVDLNGDLGTQTRFAHVNYPRVKRYYGTLASFDPGLSQSVGINMSYKNFGLKIEVAHIPSGYLTVKDVTMDGIKQKDPTERLIFNKDLILDKEPNSEWEGLYSLNNLLADSDTFTLEFTWHKGENVTEEFTTEVTVKPKTRKILRLNINGSPNYETKGNITFSMDNEDLTDEVQETKKDFSQS